MQSKLNDIKPINKQAIYTSCNNSYKLNEAIDSLKVIESLLRSLKETEDNFYYYYLELNFPIDFHSVILNYKRNLLVQALNRTKGKQTKAAELLNLKPSTLNSMIKKYKINL